MYGGQVEPYYLLSRHRQRFALNWYFRYPNQ